MNRLKLNFSLETEEERTQFLHNYLTNPIFKENPLTEDELEMCGNYILWGKDSAGLNSVDRGEVQIETRYKTWSRQDEESLEGLLEKPNFVESTLHPITAQKQKKIKDTFSREEALQLSPSYLKETFTQLFRQIDEIDLVINYYELSRGKRKNPPRSELLKVFTDEEQQHFKKKGESINQFQYLKLRHLLVELRRQQFTIRDSYSAPLRQRNFLFYNPPTEGDVLGETVPILPLGGAPQNSNLIFFDREHFDPNLTQDENLWITNFLSLQKEEENRWDYSFDFRNLDHVYNLIVNYKDFETAANEKGNEKFRELLDALAYYEDMSNLTDPQQRILYLKKEGLKNREVADIVNKEFGKAYTVNYISTIFRQKIIKKINESAEYHLKIIENVGFPENFKRCTCCKKYLLKDPRNFIRKTRTSDGFAARCKICDKKVGKKN